MKRRAFTAGALAAAGVATHDLLLPRDARAQEKITLSFLHKWPEPDNIRFFQDAVDAFQKAHPNVTITMDAVADDPYKEKIRVVMASGQIPDIYFTWVGEYTRQFIRAGRVLDLTKYLSGPDWQGRFAPATLDAYRTDGKLYGVPLNQDAKFMIYNKALFAKAGVSAPPATWPEFTAVLDKIKAAGIVPVSFGSQLAWTTAHYIGDLNAKLVPMDVREADYRLTTPADKLFTDPGYVDALTRYQEFLTKGWFNRSPNALTHAVARASFQAGREAMMYQELVEFGRIPGTKLEQDGWDFFPMPAIPDGRGRQDMLTGAPDGFVVSPGCKHPDVAMAFLAYLTSKPEGAEFTRITHRTSATIGAVTSANAPPQALRAIDEIGKAKGLVLWLDTDVESRVASAFLAGGQALMGGKATPQDVMAKVREAALAAQKERT
jgi:raffinose/stachyose/melibiose transport system substrate-binding protein